MSDNILDQLSSLRSNYVNKKQELVAKIQGNMGSIFQPIFDANPKLKGFGWPQYTPWFNDGDTCSFGARTDEPDLLLEGESEWIDGYDIYNKDVDKKEMQRNVANVLQDIPDDVLLDLFEDHVKVIVKKNEDGTISVDTETYDHD